VNSLIDIKEIAACGGAAAALKKDGTVWTWGYNGLGQLGVDSDEIPYSLDPVKAPIDNVKAVAVGDGYMLALRDDGTVWIWGNSGFEDMDEFGYDKIHLVRQIPELDSIIGIVTGNSHSIAIKDDGSVWVWGINKSGQLGNGGADMFYPVKVVR
jgi:alpha-tubulin suppressor-like RCC1 family protein